MPEHQSDICLGHEFSDPALLRRALTHRSASGRHNERLEFLGDAVLNFLVAEELFRLRPDAEEGDLSRLRAYLVRGSTLADIAAELELGTCIKLGDGERRTGGQRRRSILADTFEAVLGAVLLDGGVDAARACVQQVFAERLHALPEADSLRDPKTRLQELLQGRGIPLPVYEVTNVAGPPHAQRFTVRCSTTGPERSCEAAGQSRRKAEQAAAQLMLEQIQGSSDG